MNKLTARRQSIETKIKEIEEKQKIKKITNQIEKYNATLDKLTEQ
jgi:hypothetical protein